MKRIAPLVLVAACGFNSASSVDAGGDAPIADSGVDGEILPDGPPPDTGPDLCIGTGMAKVCFATLPTAQVGFAVDTLIDTDTSSMCAATTNPEAAGWCVIAGSRVRVELSAIVRAIGTKPLVFAAVERVQIAGTVDVSSKSTAIGAGGDSPACVAGTPATSGNSTGGGYGGTFGFRGGNGGSNDGGTGGIAALTGSVTKLRGGCPGGASGAASSLSGAGGHGGGAVALVARETILLVGARVYAYGAGGGVTTAPRVGGGGGGSGGMIILDAPAINATSALVIANGGGGAEGNGGAAGNPGEDPAAAVTPAAGGAGGSAAGGDGGTGSQGGEGSPAVDNAAPTGGGGGGGGGGAGVIKSTMALPNPILVSPSPS